jgi:hypothetical protein
MFVKNLSIIYSFAQIVRRRRKRRRRRRRRRRLVAPRPGGDFWTLEPWTGHQVEKVSFFAVEIVVEIDGQILGHHQ